jgi:excisionase family DNA binding protein
MTADRRALTVDEVAALYGVSTSHIRRLVRSGVIVKVPHMGQRVLIATGELDRVFGPVAA